MNTKSKELQVHEKQEIDRAAGEVIQEGRFYVPLVDIYENDNAIVLTADIPGVRREDVDIDLREGVLTLTARVDDVSENWHTLYREQEVGGFMRRFNLGDRIDQSKISAKVDNGVLRLELPKSSGYQPRRIEVH